MGHGLKALALIVLLSMGAAEPAAATMYRFDMTTIHGFYMDGLGPCPPGPCQNAFFADTGLSGSLGSYSGSAMLIVDDAGLGSITIAIGAWTDGFSARMHFLDRGPHSTVIKTVFQPGGFFDLCGPVVSPPNTVQGLASQAQNFTSCMSDGHGTDGYLWGGAWEVVMNVPGIRYVPEPGTLALLSLGLLGLGFTAQRRAH